MVSEAYLKDRGWFRNRRITVVGAAREGRAVAGFLAHLGADVCLTDIRPAAQVQETITALKGWPVRLVLGGHPEEVYQADLMFVSPGVPEDAPIVAEATKRGLAMSSETQLFFALCKAPIIGITGSSGKSTTTALAGEMLKHAGFRTWVGGNIGQPLIPFVDEIGVDDRVVLELSSFQLERLDTSPHVAAVLNITPNHLDRHPDMDSYVRAKTEILRHQKADDIAILGYDNDITRSLENECRGSVYFFSRRRELEQGAWLRDDTLMVGLSGEAQAICPRRDLQLRGDHNVENALAAAITAHVMGAPAKAVAEVCRTFAGIEHRLEIVDEIDGVTYVNDSIATSPERLVAALRSFDQPVILLAGGRDKHLPWEDMARLTLRRARQVVLFGEAAHLIRDAIEAAEEEPPETHLLEGISTVHGLDDAVALAASLARAGDIVLLSPGGTSFDEFRDFVERGDRFKERVRELRGAARP